MDKRDSSGNPFIIILIAVIIVAVVSLLPLNRLTEGKLSDFNLFSDLMATNDSVYFGNEDSSMPVDPMLLEAIEKESVSPPDKSEQDIIVTEDTVVVIEETYPDAMISLRDSLGVVDIEDYSVGAVGLQNLKTALLSGRLARIAVVGDSYIEGDIFTQDLRALLQERYGGNGVGYVNMYSEFPGFRRSVVQSGSGWTAHVAGKRGSSSRYLSLSESYFTPDGQAYAVYKGTTKIPHADTWDKSVFLLIAPGGAIVNLSAGEEKQSFVVEPSSEVKALSLDVTTSDFKVSLSDSTAIALGVWLDSESGIAVDCMSSRGFSGVSLGGINVELCHRMSEFINYDLIILQFGLNAMSAGQNNYSIYSQQIVKVIDHLRLCYPSADFLIMGVGDRGEKRNGEIHSMAAVTSMIDYQREAARKARCMFWDTREAMGGINAIAFWTREGLTNKDYIHMTHKGGARLAESFYESLNRLLE